MGDAHHEKGKEEADANDDAWKVQLRSLGEIVGNVP